jgi:hypothetical protein
MIRIKNIIKDFTEISELKKFTTLIRMTIILDLIIYMIFDYIHF